MRSHCIRPPILARVHLHHPRRDTPTSLANKCRRRARPFPASPTLPSAIPYPLSDPNPGGVSFCERRRAKGNDTKASDTTRTSQSTLEHMWERRSTWHQVPTNKCVVIVKSLALRKKRTQQAYPGVAKRREELTRDEDMRMANASGRLGVRGIDEGCLVCSCEGRCGSVNKRATTRRGRRDETKTKTGMGAAATGRGRTYCTNQPTARRCRGHAATYTDRRRRRRALFRSSTTVADSDAA